MFLGNKARSSIVLSIVLLPGGMYLSAAPRTNSVVQSRSTASTSFVAAPTSVFPVSRPTTQSVVTHPSTFATSVVTHPQTTSVVTHPTTASVVTHPDTLTTSVVTHPRTTSVVTHPTTTSVVTHPGEQPLRTMDGAPAAGAGKPGSVNTVPSSKSPTSMSDYKAPKAKDFNAPATAAALDGPTTGLGLTGKADESAKDSSMEAFNAQHDPQKLMSAALKGSGANMSSLSSALTKEANAVGKK